MGWPRTKWSSNTFYPDHVCCSYPRCLPNKARFRQAVHWDSSQVGMETVKGHLWNHHADFCRRISESVLNGQNSKKSQVLHCCITLHPYFCGGDQHFGPCRLTFRSYRIESAHKNLAWTQVQISHVFQHIMVRLVRIAMFLLRRMENPSENLFQLRGDLGIGERWLKTLGLARKWFMCLFKTWWWHLPKVGTWAKTIEIETIPYHTHKMKINRN